MRYGLALAGGGVRGAFHIGVWRALRKTGVEICAAVGTSVGAINGALIALDEYDEAVRLWRNISADDIVALPKCMQGQHDLFALKNLPPVIREIYKNGGLDMSPLKRLLNRVVDEDKLRRSDIMFGLALLSLSDKKGVYRFADEIPRGELTDYIVASASIFGSKRVNSETLSDAGLYDNLPVNMLLQRGIKDIIAVDAGGIGINRAPSAADANIITVRAARPQTGIMDFNRAGIVRAMEEGYIACMRALGHAAGGTYSFASDDYISARARYSPDLISGIEKAAEMLRINPFEIYTFDGLKQLVLDCYRAEAMRADTPLVKAVRSVNDGGARGDTLKAAAAISYFS